MDTKQSEEIKKNLISDIAKRQEDQIIEESNAKLLIKLIENADDLNEAINIAALGTTYKRTGFHFDKRLEKLGDDIKYFKKNEKLSFVEKESSSKSKKSENDAEVKHSKHVGAKQCEPVHKLIIGDNYDALQNLLIQYKGKVDVIYIDPPYGKDSMGEFAETNYDNAITRDNLLSMLYNRLILARELMSDDGVIFCSIDDRNHAYLKCLFDEIFTEMNFIGCLIQRKGNAQNDAMNLQKNHEYILMYSRYDISDIVVLSQKRKTRCEVLIDENKKYFCKGSGLVTGGAGGTLNKRKNLGYTIYYNRKTNDKIAVCDYDIELASKSNKEKDIYKDDGELIKKGYEIIRPPKKGNMLGCWTWSLDKFNNNKDDIYISDNKSIYQKIFVDEKDIYYADNKKYVDIERNTKNINSVIDYSTSQGTVELNAILENKIFDNAKNLDMIKFLIKSYTILENPIVLDFFAGSGTTGQAVLELNKEDGGNRQFIMCTNNEKTDTTPKGIAYDVTSKRLKRIMTGKCYDNKSNFEWIKKNEALGGSLDVYEIESVFNKEKTKGKSAFDVIDETLYGLEKFKNKNDKIKWVCENFEHTQKYLEGK